MHTASTPSLAGLSALQYYWEDLEPGTVFETASRTITETDVVGFAGLSADYNRLHVDAEYASATAWGKRIAHGMLVASILSGLNTRTVVNQLLEPSLVGLLEMNLRFPKPTLIGDTIHGRIKVSGRRETSNPRAASSSSAAGPSTNATKWSAVRRSDDGPAPPDRPDRLIPDRQIEDPQ